MARPQQMLVVYIFKLRYFQWYKIPDH